MFGDRNALWLIWVGGALVAAILEVLSLDFVFSMLVGGALAAALTALLGHGFTAQVIVFAVTSAVLLVTVRPAIKRWARTNSPMIHTNVDALRSRPVEVLTEVTDKGGTVKLAGETWTARTAVAGAVLAVGTAAEVVEIDGATAVVRPLPPQDSPPPFTLPSSPSL